MTVAELIAELQKYPKDMLVAFPMWSEQLLLDKDNINVKKLCKVREDGWIQNYRSDKPHVDYLVLGG